jgi:hypothetical protein
MPGENISNEAQEEVFNNLGISQETLNNETSTADERIEQDGHEEQQETQQETRQEKPEVNDLTPAKRFPERAGVRPDGKGNLVDREGRVIATAGREARIYQELHRTKQGLDVERRHRADLDSRLNRAIGIAQELEREVTQYKAQQTQIEKFGVSPSEQLEALQLVAEAKQNPMNVLKKLLTRAAAQGIDLSELGMKGGTDTKAMLDVIREEIGKATHPLIERSQAEKRQEAAQREKAEVFRRTETDVRNFFNQNPGAKQYVPVFHAVLKDQRFAHMSLGEIWARTQLNLLKNRQHAPARRIPAGKGQPMSNGRSDMAPISTSYDDILREVLSVNGIQ